jgi:peptidoglycan/LPS O-acetylase OafA/YrhL
MSIENTLQNTPQTPTQTAKIGSINTLRFIAAVFVVFYHFTFVYYHAELSYVNVPILRYLFQYGYLGVDLFFIISGFVISLSAEGRGAYTFFKSRIGRLYPVFWVSAIVTTLFLMFGGHLISSDMTLWRFWTNMTMVPTIIWSKETIDFIDGAYWTLAIEMKFYFFILLLLILKQFKKIEYIAIASSFAILIFAMFSNIKVDSDLIWIPNFLTGIIFYKIYKNGLNNWRIFALINTFIASLIFAVNRAPYLTDGYKTVFSTTTISFYILIFYILFLLISLNKIKIPNNKYINALGLLTFPIYLLHQQIAKIMFTYSNIHNIPLYISFTFILLFIFVISFLVHKMFERRGRIILDKTLDRFTPKALKHF